MKCPGQDSRYWDQNAIYESNCPQCGSIVEFFKDDPTRTCKKCGHRFINPKLDFGCASYCQHADQCVGSLPADIIAQREDLLKDRVAIEMKRYFRNDFKRIGHASRVARHAEHIGIAEKGNLAVILTAAYLHDIGITEAERKYKSSSPRYQHIEGPPIAREILRKLNAKEELIEEVSDIVGHHHTPRKEETTNFKAVYDADLIVNLEEKLQESPLPEDKLNKIFDTAFLTKAGRELAGQVLRKK